MTMVRAGLVLATALARRISTVWERHQGGRVANPPALGAFLAARFARRVAVLGIALLALLSMSDALAQTAPGAVINNRAQLDYQLNGAPRSVLSNTVSATVLASATRSTISILRYAGNGAVSVASTGPTQCRRGSTYTPLPDATLQDGTVIAAAQPGTLNVTDTVHGGEPVFLRLLDADQNRQPSLLDTIDLTLQSASGDREQVRLTETGPDTGEFVGHIPTAAAAASSGDCVLQVLRNESLVASYTDPITPADASSSTALVDPFGLVFDSRTGAPIDGARVRLVDIATGADAVVYGDDGVSRYPSIMTTGAAVTDSGGTVYTLPAGVYRFPLVTPGQYRLEILPPSGHAFPSELGAAALQQVPGAPFRIGDGSYGRPFTASAPPAVANIDVPLDPTGTQLFVQKSASTQIVAIGDFLQYTVTVENAAGTGAFRAVTLADSLPAGLRYRAGSARIDNAPLADPGISADGRVLTFVVGRLDAGARRSLSYVTEVVAGARGNNLVNSAMATAIEGVASNTAEAGVQLRDELFHDAGVLVGRILQGGCDVAATSAPGIAGVRVYLEDGRYALTDEEGKYHFEGVPPGTHVVQLDTATIPPELEAATCEHPVTHAGRSFSQFVELRAGSLWRADFRLAPREPPRGDAQLQLSSTALDGKRLAHAVTVRNGAVAMQGLRISVMLPEGLAFAADSTRLDDRPIGDPKLYDNVLVFLLGALPANGTAVLHFETRLAAGPGGEHELSAIAMFATPAQLQVKTLPATNRIQRIPGEFESADYRFTPRFEVLRAELQQADRAALDAVIAQWRGVRKLRIRAVGHTDSTPIAARNRAVFADNHALSAARARAVAEYLRDGLNLADSQLEVIGRGADEPLQAGTDAASLAANRRVEISIAGERQRADESVTVSQPQGASTPVQTIGSWKRATTSSLPPAVRPAPARADADIDLEALTPGAAWIWPAADARPAIPAIKIAISHGERQSLTLSVNGKPVSPLNFDGVSYNQARTVAVSRWRGVELAEGENQLLAVVSNADGSVASTLSRTLHYGDGAVRARVVREQSLLTADGTTRPVIALQLFDRYGKAARAGTMGAFSVEAPYRSWWEVQTLHDNQLLAVGYREPTFEVDSDGIARIELEPTAQAGTVLLRLRFNERQTQELRVWLEPSARDWILVGLAAGTASYNTVADNMVAAADAGLEDGYASDGRIAFFAKGAVRGSYLLTAAFDSARDPDGERRRLLGTIEPDRYYTIYGDGTEQRFEAASTEKLYLKLERGQFYALFGDYQTGLTVTELSRYSRSFTGLKSEYAGERYAYTAFASDTDQNQVRDELEGDGASGLYRLSRRDLVINSDKVRIEVRDRLRPEQVIETRTLSRYLDYSIDYRDGTLFFRQPVASRDAGFNPQVIVAEYEVLGDRSAVTGGGRVALKVDEQNLEVGGSFVQQGADAGDTRIGGLDLRWDPTDATRVRAEIARSDSDDPARAAGASAYLAEVRHVTERIDTRIYTREQQSGFGLEQQSSVDAGSRRVGLDGRLRFTERWSLRGEAYRQDVLDTDARRQLASAELRFDGADQMLTVGARDVEDSQPGLATQTSRQAFVGGSVDLWQDRIRLRASQEFALSGADASSDFPTRTLLGADYRWNINTTFFADYEHAEGEALQTDMTRLGVRTVPWRRAQLQSAVAQEFTEYGPRTFSTLGLTQGWQPNERWTLDTGVDQNRTLRGPTLRPLNSGVPLASGSTGDDFFAAFVGALYRTPLWSFTSRLEHRDADSERRWIATSGFYREPLKGHAFSLAATLMDSAALAAGGSDSRMADLRLSWAYRPISSRWIILNRLDLRSERTGGGIGLVDAARIVNNFNANWQLDAGSQLGIQLAGKFTRSSFGADRYSSLATLTGLDYRRDLSQRFDVGFHGATLQSWNAATGEMSLGIDVGATLARNVWIALGYNFRGFDDRDFNANRYTASGPFLTVRIKADQDTFKDLSLSSLRPRR